MPEQAFEWNSHQGDTERQHICFNVWHLFFVRWFWGLKTSCVVYTDKRPICSMVLGNYILKAAAINLVFLV